MHCYNDPYAPAASLIILSYLVPHNSQEMLLGPCRNKIETGQLQKKKPKKPKPSELTTRNWGGMFITLSLYEGCFPIFFKGHPI
jgi:hypothetical protein